MVLGSGAGTGRTHNHVDFGYAVVLVQVVMLGLAGMTHIGVDFEQFD